VNSKISMNFSLKAIILISFFTLINTCINAQNLISNGDFEEFSVIPDDFGQISRAIGWRNLNGTFEYTNTEGSPDYLHLDGINTTRALTPISGYGQAGFVTYWYRPDQVNFREYISTKLIKPLTKNSKYKLTFYYTNGKLPNNSTYQGITNGIGAAFTIDTLSQTNRLPINFTPQVECLDVISSYASWQRLSFVFTADETFRHIAIGNFRDDANTLVEPIPVNIAAYYYIDKIELVEMNYNLCIGDTIELEHFSRDSSYAWALAESPSDILSTDKTLKVSPTINTTYLLFTGVDTISFPVIIVYPLQSVIEHQQPICYGKPLLLNAGNSGASFLWQDQSTNSTFQVTQPGNYYVEISNACGTITDTVRVDTNCVALLEMPNVFTPNGDGINDLFIPIKTQQINNLTFSIYNRWGNQIAEIKPNMIGWDGKNGEESCPEGVYFWLAIYSDKFGMQYSQKGFVQLIR
jgi:gliding motility-associated-like protein